MIIGKKGDRVGCTIYNTTLHYIVSQQLQYTAYNNNISVTGTVLLLGRHGNLAGVDVGPGGLATVL